MALPPPPPRLVVLVLLVVGGGDKGVGENTDSLPTFLLLAF